MEYKQIKTRRIYEEVADTLLELIKSGAIKTGDKLESVEQLAKNFNVSRSAIREALSALRAMGIVEMRQGEGTYVKQFDSCRFSVPVSIAFLMKRDDIKQLLEVRKILEVGAVASAAKNYKEEDLLPIEEALMEMEQSIGNEELAEQADFNFHMAIADATHNDMLISLMKSVSDIMIETMGETRRLWLEVENNTSKLNDEHQEIYKAIKGRDKETAQKYMFIHLQKVEDTLVKYIN
ncbi:FadR/GntR family transcriptional regulator [Bacillaceae bacterium S4-13-56]